MQLINKEAIVQYLMKTRNEMQADGNEYILGQKTGLATAVGIILSFPTVEERKVGIVSICRYAMLRLRFT